MDWFGLEGLLKLTQSQPLMGRDTSRCPRLLPAVFKCPWALPGTQWQPQFLWAPVPEPHMEGFLPKIHPKSPKIPFCQAKHQCGCLEGGEEAGDGALPVPQLLEGKGKVLGIFSECFSREAQQESAAGCCLTASQLGWGGSRDSQPFCVSGHSGEGQIHPP